MKNQEISRPRPQQKGRKSATEVGSVIFIILIAVALFAALSFVIMQTSRTGTGTLTEQQAKLAASSAINYMNSVKGAVNALIIKGCDPIKIDFSTPVFIRKDGTQIDSTPPGAQSGCTLFSTSEGGAKAVILEDVLEPSYVPPNASDGQPLTFAVRYADANIGSSANDLIFRTTGAKESICLALLNMVKTNGPDYTSIPIVNYPTAGLNSWTRGTAGSLNPKIPLIPGSSIFATKYVVSHNQCSFGIVLKAY